MSIQDSLSSYPLGSPNSCLDALNGREDNEGLRIKIQYRISLFLFPSD